MGDFVTFSKLTAVFALDINQPHKVHRTPGRFCTAVLLGASALSFLVPATPSFAQAVIWSGGTGNWFPPSGGSSNWFTIVGGFPVVVAPPNGAGPTANIGTSSGFGAINGSVFLNGPVSLPAGIVLGQAGATGSLTISSPANTLSASRERT
jgi:hypothetical protein